MDDVIFDQAALLAMLNGDEVAKDLQRRALQVEGAAVQLCPVDTGRLRASITNALGQDEISLFAVIGSNVEYAAYVEFGTGHMAAQPYLRPALGAAGG